MVWMILTMILASLLAFSLIGIMAIGLDANWTWDNYLSVLIFIFLLPVVWPFYLWHAIKERKTKNNLAPEESAIEVL